MRRYVGHCLNILRKERGVGFVSKLNQQVCKGKKVNNQIRKSSRNCHHPCCLITISFCQFVSVYPIIRSRSNTVSSYSTSWTSTCNCNKIIDVYYEWNWPESSSSWHTTFNVITVTWHTSHFDSLLSVG